MRGGGRSVLPAALPQNLVPGASTGRAVGGVCSACALRAPRAGLSSRHRLSLLERVSAEAVTTTLHQVTRERMEDRCRGEYERSFLREFHKVRTPASQAVSPEDRGMGFQTTRLPGCRSGQNVEATCARTSRVVEGFLLLGGDRCLWACFPRRQPGRACDMPSKACVESVPGSSMWQ